MGSKGYIAKGFSDTTNDNLKDPIFKSIKSRSHLIVDFDFKILKRKVAVTICNYNNAVLFWGVVYFFGRGKEQKWYYLLML